MKKALVILTAAILLLACAGCAQSAPAASSASASASVSAEPVNEKAWSFDVQTQTYLDEYTTQDGSALCSGRYEYPVLRLVDDGGNPYDGQGTPPPEELQAVCDAFNDQFREESYVSSYTDLKFMALSGWNDSHRYSYSGFFPWEETQNVTSVYTTPHFLCVEYVSYSYTGGAHGSAGWNSVCFDLDRGVFVEWEELATDETALRARLGSAVLAAIQQEDMAGSLFDSYEQDARRLAYATCGFGEQGMNITFSEYSIGPYAVGMPCFLVEYEKFDDLLNDYGRTLLGRP